MAGFRLTEGDYVDGHPQGQWTEWHANGTRAGQGPYGHGKKHGKWTEWSADGKVTKITHFRNGEVVPKSGSTAETDGQSTAAERTKP